MANPMPQFEYLACHVTIWNESSQALTNADIVKEWGKYPTQPATNQAKNSWQSFTMTGRSSSWSGCEGSVTYQVGYQPGFGSTKFYYTCPVDGDNEAVPTNNSIGLQIAVYAEIGEKSGESGWGVDPSKWGKEGQVPIDDHPLSILFVIRDAPQD